jgi:hypothetical protein
MTEGETIRSTILSWERLRLSFNLVLLAEGLFLSFDLIAQFGGFLPWAFWILVFGLTANAWFSFGPLIEIYSLTFRKSGFGNGRYWLFALLLLAGALVVLYLSVMTALSSGQIFRT